MQHRSGITILEMLVAVVVISILAAVLIVRYQGAEEKARLATLQNDLRSYATAQELRFADRSAFAQHPDSLSGYALSSGVRVVSASATGARSWALVLEHAKGERCGRTGGLGAFQRATSGTWCGMLEAAGTHSYTFEGGSLNGFDSWSENPNESLGVAEPGSPTPDGEPSIRVTGEHWIEGERLIPYEAGKTYTVSASFRNVELGAASDHYIYLGLLGYAADGTTPINQKGGATRGCAHWVAGSAKRHTPSEGWLHLSGSFSGWVDTRVSCATGGSGLHKGVAYVRPVALVNYKEQDGKTEVGSIRLEVR
jgi:type II secretory pathway pseudopilin PulG